ncbi:hypothetical protein LTR56_016144 [Elasticomyces elasticus]|nr:hypothetical protein LTR56_016144 [Elasticomyces elasticus]KAK3637912.1 hypothetical protein LTR22_018050 [Elasticomyces elasticus]KAK4918301.1 hypothetical protein LTR49_013851 [Elasticomyces elasticus]KAK5762749.1 hypothetical protein LTS12_007138 [Elasticomyces elasticus]
MDKTSISNSVGGAISMPGVRKNINAVTIDGHDYHLTTELHEEFMHDFHNMAGDAMVKKYALVKVHTADERDGRQVPDSQGVSK